MANLAGDQVTSFHDDGDCVLEDSDGIQAQKNSSSNLPHSSYLYFALPEWNGRPIMRRLSILFLLLLAVSSTYAQIGGTGRKQPPDARVKAALEEIGYKYELTENNNYKLIPIETEQTGTKPDGTPIYRSQLVYVNSTTEKYGSLEIREVWSPGFYSAGPLSAALANRLLRENNSVKFGAWRVEVQNDSGKYLAMFAAQIAANSDAESLRLAIKSVILVADRMEKELTGTDDY